MSTSTADATEVELAATAELPRAKRTPTLVGLPPARAPMETLRQLPNLPRSGGRAALRRPLPPVIEDERTPISSVRPCRQRARAVLNQSDFSDTVVEPLLDLEMLDFAPTAVDPDVEPLPASMAGDVQAGVRRAHPSSHVRELAPRSQDALPVLDESTAIMDTAQLGIRPTIDEQSSVDYLAVRPHPLPAVVTSSAAAPAPVEEAAFEGLGPDARCGSRAPAGLVVWPPQGLPVPRSARRALQSMTKITRRPPSPTDLSWARPVRRAPAELTAPGVQFTRLLGYLILVTLAAIVVVQMLSAATL